MAQWLESLAPNLEVSGSNLAEVESAQKYSSGSLVRPTHVVAQSSGRGVSVVYPLPGEERNLGRPFKGRVLRTAVLEIPDPHTFLPSPLHYIW